MSRCWADSLGDCVGPITGEHIVSSAVFTENVISVQGFRWCKDEPRQIGVNGLTANVLCGRHNSTTSNLDSAAGNAMQVLRHSVALCEKNKKLMPWITPKIQHFRIDAGLLERWMLKTTLNLKYGSLLGEGNVVAPGSAATLEEAELCFGLRPFTGAAGMYTAYANGANLRMLDKVTINTLLDNGELVGARFELHGFRFLLNLRSESELPPLETIAGMDPAWNGAFLSRRFKHARFNHLSFPSHYVNFDWTSARIA